MCSTSKLQLTCGFAAEVVLFTAGLEDYAKPIADALDNHHDTCFQDRRLYRPATVACDLYPCIKDLSRLGRDLRRTVLIDDTPLAFLKQPDNGIPIYGFRCVLFSPGRFEITWRRVCSIVQMWLYGSAVL